MERESYCEEESELTPSGGGKLNGGTCIPMLQLPEVEGAGNSAECLTANQFPDANFEAQGPRPLS